MDAITVLAILVYFVSIVGAYWFGREDGKRSVPRMFLESAPAKPWGHIPTPDIRQELETVLVRIAKEHGVVIRRLSASWTIAHRLGDPETAILSGIDIEADVMRVHASSTS